MLLGFLPDGLLTKADAAPSTTEANVTALFNARSYGQHPRILANTEDFARIREQVRTDPYMRILYERIYDYCLTQLSEPVVKYEIPDGVRLLGVSRTASQRIVWLAMAYQISGEARFAQRAIKEMLAVSAFSDWHPAHYLDTAQMAYGVGLGYDWLYHEMTASQRNTVCTAMYNYALQTYSGKSFQNGSNNWNPWCHGGIAIAAAAIFESYPSACAKFFASSVTNIQKALAVLTPLGAYPEGPGYFCVASEFMALFMDTLATVLGTDFGLSDLDGVKESGKYLLAVNGNVSAFNFGDGSGSLQDSSALHWYAKRYNMPELSVYQRERQYTGIQAVDVLGLVWYDPELVGDMTEEDIQLDYLMYSDAYESVASFRSPAGDARQIYTAIKSGYNSTGHSDMDIGTFVMEAMGVRFIEDMGSDNYNLSGYGTSSNGIYAEDGKRWTYYRKRAEGQNTLVLNPSTKGGQDAVAKAQIVGYGSTYDGGYAAVNMLDAYDSYTATSAKRALALFDNRSRVLVRDEITCSSASTLYWFAHTRAEISISVDKKSAVLTSDGKQLLVQIAEPSNATFTAMDAQPLSTSPKPSGENSREGWRKLSICLKNIKSANITVVFTPLLEEGDGNKALPAATLANLPQLLHSYESGTQLLANEQGVYEIHDANELMLFADMVNNGTDFQGKTVKLLSDIDLQGHSFVPIGGVNGTNYFRGTFDGGNHVVRNLCIFRPGSASTGFFGRTDKATICNFGIESGVVFGGEKSGALTGIAGNTTIQNCFNRANVIANGGHVGGLIGQVGGTSVISDSYNHATIRTSGKICGGLVGYASSKTDLTVSNSYHVGNLSDSSGYCGMIGYYNTGDSTMYPTAIRVKNCFSTTDLKDDSVANLSSVESYSGSAKLSSARMISVAPTLGSAFIADCEWENDGYPVFTWQCETVLPEDLHLSTAAELRLFAHTVNTGDTYAGKTVYLDKDVDLDSREWIPIGGNSTDNTSANRFKGNFDGQGYCVRNLSVTTGNDFVGFFGVAQGSVKNFGIQSGSVKGGVKVGGLIGWVGGTVSNCYNRATVSGSTFVGGIAGMSGVSHIENSFNNANITAGDTGAGIVGYYASAGSGSTITNCYHNGTVSGATVASVVGVINSASTGLVFKNTYSPKGFAFVYTSTGRTLSGCSTLVEADLKAAASKLGSAFRDDDVRNKNGGYPVLNRRTYRGQELELLTPEADGVYRIYEVQDLYALSYMVNVQGQTFSGKTVELCTDLDLQGREWVPIGGNSPTDSSARPEFNGNFDGKGHKISSLNVSSGNSFVGLFGFMRGGSVSNVGIESGVVFGSEKVSALVGSIRSTKIRNCYNRANVSATTIAGGIFGMGGASGNVIENCYNTGWVTATSSVGGVGGYLASDASDSTIRNCYNLGQGSSGILGVCNANATGILVENSYTHNAVGLFGTQNVASLKNSKVLSAAELREIAPTLGTAYAEDYQAKNWAYPVLAWENGNCATELSRKDGIYQINGEEDLRLLSYLVRKGNTFAGKSFVLNTDIDLEGRAWMPIGGVDEIGSTSFNGTLDGRGHVIHNLVVAESEYGAVGLFGQIKGGTVENLGIESGVVIGMNKAGGLVGVLGNKCTLRACYSKAYVYADTIAGGLVGMVGGANCTIDSCYTVTWTSARARGNNVGGFVGYYGSGAKNCVIENSYNVGSFNGLLGSINSSAEGNTIRNSYSSASVYLLRNGETMALDRAELISLATLRNYAPVLGELFDTDIAGLNRGYPVLAWESGKQCFHELSYAMCTATEHTVTCGRCQETWQEAHSFVNGLCLCGETEAKEPVEDSTLKLSHSLNLASDISVNLVVPKTMLADFDLSTVYVESTYDIYTGNIKTGTTTVELRPVESGYYYYFTLNGLTAVQMNNRISSVLYGTKNGQPYCSPVDDYAIADYAYSQLNKTNTTDKLRTLCADLLRYGAKAQIYKNYRTDFLADSAMTAEHQTRLSDTEAVTFGNVNEDLKDLENAPVAWAGKTLNLDSKVCLKFVFKTSGYAGELSDLSLCVSYEDRNGERKTVVLTETEVYNEAAQMYSFTVDALLAAELRSVVSAQIYAGDTPVSTTLRYSPDTYGNGKTGTLGELCKALFAYSDSARRYFSA